MPIFPSQPVLCSVSVTGSSSIITYAIFQNVVRSPEVRTVNHRIPQLKESHKDH